MATLPFIPVPTTALASELAQLPATLRAQMLFSARLEILRPLLTIGENVGKILEGGGSLSESRRDIRKALEASGYVPGGDGLLDHTSSKRLNLILQQNIRSARNYEKLMNGMDPDALEMFPAQELVRVYRRTEPRDWKHRWAAAGGTFSGGRMIALKTAPIWTNLSRFGTPWPPFDYGSGMGVADVSRAEAESFGLLEPTDQLTPSVDAFDFSSPELPAPGIDGFPQLKQAILEVMGKDATFDGNVLRFASSAAEAGTKSLSAVSSVQTSEATALIRSRNAVVKDPTGHLQRFDSGLLDTAKEAELKNIRAAFEAIRSPDSVTDRDGFRVYTKQISGIRTSVRTKAGKVTDWTLEAAR